MCNATPSTREITISLLPTAHADFCPLGSFMSSLHQHYQRWPDRLRAEVTSKSTNEVSSQPQKFYLVIYLKTLHVWLQRPQSSPVLETACHPVPRSGVWTGGWAPLRKTFLRHHCDLYSCNSRRIAAIYQGECILREGKWPASGKNVRLQGRVRSHPGGLRGSSFPGPARSGPYGTLYQSFACGL